MNPPTLTSSDTLLTEPCILIIEDDVGIQEAMKSLFEMVDIQASFAGSGEEALAALKGRRTPPSLIVVDGRLPDTHGLFLAQQMRPLVLPGTAMYLFSADPRQSFGSEAQLVQAGITGFIEKPFDADDFIDIALQHTTSGLH